MRTQSATTTITRAVTVAAGVFAPGHLGELTQFLPFELVDDVLEQTRTVQRRLRDLPSRVGVYFLLALGMYPRLGYARVWAKLTAGLDGLPVACPSEKALRDLRRRVGPAPLKALFKVVAGPLAQPGTPGVRFGGLRTVAFDGCNSLKVPDTGRNRCWLGRIRYRMGFAGYPALRLMALAETGTRGLLGAALGSAADRDEAAVARRLLPLLRAGMLVLLDRAFDANAFLAEVAATGALLLARAKSTRRPPVLSHLPDGSYLSCLGGLAVRVIEASVTVTGADGSRVRDGYRLITTLMDYRRFPAAAVVRLYHERWEIESAYFALRHTLLDGHVLRSGDRPGLEQETWALLTLYQLLRMAMVDAVETRPGTDPDRASFTTAMEAAKDQLTAAAGVCPDWRASHFPDCGSFRILSWKGPELPGKIKNYSPEFRDEAARLVVETSRAIADVARELGISETSLGNWVRAYREKHAEDEPPLQVSERARLRELERQNRELEMENTFLKKAAAYFAREHR